MITGERHLKAILFTDIVGFTTMMKQNETAAMQAIMCHERVLYKLVPSFGGKIQQLLGDGDKHFLKTS